MAKKEQTKTDEQQEVKKTAAKKTAKAKTLEPQESVIIMACKNANLIDKIQKMAEKDGIKVVLTNDQAIDDYLAHEGSQIDEGARMTAFLEDERNRKIAFVHAKEIFTILVGKKEDMVKWSGVTLSKKSLVKNTTLSWSRADEVLNTLEAFGFAKRINKGMDFQLFFDLKLIRENIRNDVTLSVESLNYDIQRYMGAVNESSDIEDAQKHLADFKAEIQKNIVF